MRETSLKTPEGVETRRPPVGGAVQSATRLARALLVLVMAAAATGPPAAADHDGPRVRGTVRPGVVTVIVRGASNPGNSAGTPTTTVRCTWHLPGVNGRPGAIIRKSDTVIGQPYTRVCRRGGRITSVRILIPRSELPGGQADLALPAPTLALSPRPDIGGVVGMDTWLAIAGVPQRQERWVSAGGLLALAGAVPTDTLTWTIAEIDPLTGQPMPESAEEDRVWMVECPVDAAQFGTADPQAVGCTHVFPRSGRYRIIASLTWNVALLSTDPAAPLQRLPDTLTVGSADLDVVELDTVITDMRGPRPLR